MMEREDDRPVSFRAEVAGWLAFALFVTGVYRLRQTLNRQAETKRAGPPAERRSPAASRSVTSDCKRSDCER